MPTLSHLRIRKRQWQGASSLRRRLRLLHHLRWLDRTPLARRRSRRSLADPEPRAVRPHRERRHHSVVLGRCRGHGLARSSRHRQVADCCRGDLDASRAPDTATTYQLACETDLWLDRPESSPDARRLRSLPNRPQRRSRWNRSAISGLSIGIGKPATARCRPEISTPSSQAGCCLAIPRRRSSSARQGVQHGQPSPAETKGPGTATTPRARVESGRWARLRAYTDDVSARPQSRHASSRIRVAR